MSRDSYELTLQICIMALFSCAFIYQLIKLVRFFLHRRLIRVACWFCQGRNSVPATAVNSFICAACNQYNGFTKDGDYNLEIPAQFQSTLNTQAFMPQTKNAFKSQSDVLCSSCNKKQEYKLRQLALFEPSSKSKWDKEFTKFQQNLEKLCSLCFSCGAKTRHRVQQVDGNVLPGLLSWWHAKGTKQKIFPIRQSKIGSHHRFNSAFTVIDVSIRILMAFLWLIVLFANGSIMQFLCVPETNSSFVDLILVIFRRGGFNHSTHCPKFIEMITTFFGEKEQFEETMLRLYMTGFSGHTTLLLLQIIGRKKSTKTNPFFILLDTVLATFAVNCLLMTKGISTKQLIGRATAHSSLLMASMVSTFLIGLVILVIWLWAYPYFVCDLSLQKETLKQTWPSNETVYSNMVAYSSVESSVAPQCSDTFSSPQSTKSINRPIEHSLSLDGLSLNSSRGFNSSRSLLSPNNTSHFLRPPLLSHKGYQTSVYSNSFSPPPQYVPQEYCSSLCPSRCGPSPSISGQEYAASAALFPQPSYADQFSSIRYAASAAPGLLSLKRGDAADDRDNWSNVTSVSQRPEINIKTRQGGSSRHRRHKQPRGLLPWLLCLLFGRLDSWSEVKAVLTCLANSVLMCLLLVCICHLFSLVVPAIWQMQV